MLPPCVYQMPSGARSRPSLDATRTSRPPPTAAVAPATTRTKTPPSTKSFTKMLKTSVQGTLRAAGLAGPTTSTTTTTSRPKQSPASNHEDQRTLRPTAAATAATAATVTPTATAKPTNGGGGNNKKRDESRTARGLRKLEGGMNYVRSRRITLTLRPSQPQQPPPSAITTMHNDTDADADADIEANGDPAMTMVSPSPHLRNPSMSSPDLLLSSSATTTRPSAIRTRSNQQQQQQQQHQQRRQQHQPPRPPRDSSQPQPISRPRPLIPASISSTSLVHGPDTPSRNKQPHSPTRKVSIPISVPIMRNPSASASTSHLPQSKSSPYGIYPTHHRNTSSTSLLSSPYRESIRKASSLLVRELLKPPQGVKPRDWEHIEFRLRTLVRLERIWGKSGATSSSTALATSSTIGMGGSEDRERRIFCESVRDGYVLCM
jgi:hypothetical protein